jgi:hypothetical protein
MKSNAEVPRQPLSLTTACIAHQPDQWIGQWPIDWRVESTQCERTSQDWRILPCAPGLLLALNFGTVEQQPEHHLFSVVDQTLSQGH